MTALPWLFALAGLISLDGRTISPLLPAIAGSLGATAGEVGLSVTAYTLGYGLFQVIYGPLSDRHGRLRVIRVTALLFAVGSGLSALAGGLPEFIAARLFTGSLAAATIPTTFAWVGDTVRYERRQRLLGHFAVVTNGAQALGAALAGLAAHLVSWRLLFAATAILTVGVVAVMGGHDERRGLPTASPGAGYAEILETPGALGFFGLVFAEGFFLWGGSTYFGALVSERLGWNELQIGLLVAAYGLGTIAGGLALGALLPRLGERGLALAGGAVQAGGYLALATPAPWPVLAAGLLAIGFGLAALHSTFQTYATELAPRARGRAFAIFATALFAGGAGGTAALGWLVDSGGTGAAMAACGVGLGVVGWALAARGRVSPRRGS